MTRDGEKLRASYFSQFPGVWAQGDYAEQLPHGAMMIHGRSDAVLNPGGVRIGTAEIYRQVEKVPQVLDSVAIGQQWQDDVRVVLFVRLHDGVELDEALQQQIRQVIRANTTPRHVPAKIVAVTDIPRTISGKVVELAVRNVVHGQKVKNTDALANPAGPGAVPQPPRTPGLKHRLSVGAILAGQHVLTIASISMAKSTREAFNDKNNDLMQVIQRLPPRKDSRRRHTDSCCRTS